MNLGKWRWILIVTALVVLNLGIVFAQEERSNNKIQQVSEKIEFISVDELKSMVEKSEPVIIIDVRGQDYNASPAKIKGAIRIAPGEFEAHIKDLPHDKKIVTYCACPTEGGAIKVGSPGTELEFAL